MIDDDAPFSEPTSSVRTWIVSIAICLVLVGAFLYYRDVVMAPDAPDAETDTFEKNDKKKRASNKKKRRKTGKKRHGMKSRPANDKTTTQTWENDGDFVPDNSILGDVFSEPDAVEPVVAAKEGAPYQPKRREYQPTGPYQPTASYKERGASTSNATVINMGAAGGSSKSLRSDQIRSTMTIGKLIGCYRPWVDKIPQMRGRVDFKMVVEKDGHPSVVKITRSDLRSRVVEECLVNKARRLRFPKTTAPSRFSTNFSFSN